MQSIRKSIRIDSGGYVKIWRPNHPRADKNHYVPEHILIMEQKLGRYIRLGEWIHHKDHDRQNNDIKNLQLVDYIEHRNIHTDEMAEVRNIICWRCGSIRTRKMSIFAGRQRYGCRDCNRTFFTSCCIDRNGSLKRGSRKKTYA